MAVPKKVNIRNIQRVKRNLKRINKKRNPKGIKNRFNKKNRNITQSSEDFTRQYFKGNYDNAASIECCGDHRNANCPSGMYCARNCKCYTIGERK